MPPHASPFDFHFPEPRMRNAFAVVILLPVWIMAADACYGARARDLGQWAQVSRVPRELFRSRTIPPEARKRLGVPYTSCCDHADVFRTRFRVGAAREDVWEFLDRDARWKVVPADIISEAPSPDGEPILFRRAQDGEPF